MPAKTVIPAGAAEIAARMVLGGHRMSEAAAIQATSSSSATPRAAAPFAGLDRTPTSCAGDTNAAEDAETKRAKRYADFNIAHELKFGLQVVKRDDATGKVMSALCLFCKHFGREEKEGRKRRATINLKYFKPSFRTDQYVQHLMSQHPRMWTKYRLASDDGKLAFFQVTTKDELPAVSSSSSSALVASASSAARPAMSRRTVESRVKSDADTVSASAETKLRLAPAHALAAPAPLATPVSALAVASAPVPVETMEPEPSPAPAVEMSAPAPTAPSPTLSVATHLASDDDPTRSIDVKQSIVDFVVAGSSSASTGELWRPRTFRSSELVQVPSAEDTTTATSAVYRVLLRSRVQLDLAVDFLAAGLTHQQLAKALTAVVMHTGLDPAVAAADTDAFELVRLSTAMSLDAIAQLLEQSWAFTVGVHTAAHASCVDIQLRVCSNAAVHSVHLVVLPLGAHDTDVEALYATFARTMDAVFPTWRRRLVGLGSDRDAKHSECIAALSARIEREAPYTVYRSHCSRAQLDAAMQQFYRALLSGAFLASFRALRAYIQSQESLVLEMGHPPSAASLHPWLAMGKDTKWITDKRVRLRKHLDDAASSSSSRTAARALMPDDAWWVAFFVAHWVASRANDAFKTLESKRLSVAQQTDVLADLLADLIQAFNVEGPVRSSRSRDDGSATESTSRGYSVSDASVRDFLGDLGVFVNNIVARAAPAALDTAVGSVATSLADLVEALAAMTADEQRSSSNSNSREPDAASADELPPVLPHELAQLSGREFAALLARHDEPLHAFFSDEELDVIDQEHQALRRASAKDKALQVALIQCDDETPFERAWSLTSSRFRALERFAGGLATVFATSTAVASVPTDCSAAAAPASVHGSRMDDALEATLHAQQFHRLQRLVQQPQRSTKRKLAEL